MDINNYVMTGLLVEDDQFKEAALIAFIKDEFGSIEVHTARSLTSAIAQLHKNPPDLIFLDMSLPTFDVSTHESGGRPNGFGGWDLMRYLYAKKIHSKVIVVTQFETFELNNQLLTIETLKTIFATKFEKIFEGLIKYESISNSWKSELKRLIENVLQKKN